MCYSAREDKLKLVISPNDGLDWRRSKGTTAQVRKAGKNGISRLGRSLRRENHIHSFPDS